VFLRAKLCILMKVLPAEYTEEMGRLSDDIMTMFGVKPSDQRKDHAVSTAPHRMFIIKLLII